LQLGKEVLILGVLHLRTENHLILQLQYSHVIFKHLRLYLESHGVVDNNFFDPKLNARMDPHLDAFWNFDNVTLPLWVWNNTISSVVLV